ncbi:MAG: argininosuccinate synthase [Planctomycetota bacterium]|jgi:argininosuccinate synthase
MAKKVVLAYSGGLDTSVCIPWIKDNKGSEVIAFSADLGQGEELAPVEDKARKSGAVKVYIEDLRERFLTEFVWPALRARATYSNGYLLATALGRPLIGAELVRIALENDADGVAHGCTGKGNDQVRIEAAVRALAPKLEVIAPLREWDMKSREEEIEYAKERGIPVPVSKKSPYSYDRNLWGQSIECGVLEDPWASPPEDAYQMTKNPESAPDAPVRVELEFENGVPVGLDGKARNPVELVEQLNEIGGEHGVGRCDVVEDRLVGIKSREVYEAPAGTIIYAAHRSLMETTVSRDLIHMAAPLSAEYGRLTYYGLWFSHQREALDGFFASMNRVISGKVRLRLHKGSAVVEGRQSPESLYSEKLATYTVEDVFDHSAAQGFIKLWCLPLAAEAARAKQRGKDG